MTDAQREAVADALRGKAPTCEELEQLVADEVDAVERVVDAIVQEERRNCLKIILEYAATVEVIR